MTEDQDERGASPWDRLTGGAKDTAEKNVRDQNDAAADWGMKPERVGTLGWRQIVGSTIVFRSVAAALILLAVAQWSMIFFNYWR